MAATPAEPHALDAALERVGDRWTLRLVEALLESPRKFGELAVAVDGIAPNILTDRLRRLERHGIVVAEPYMRRPVRHVYRLTAEGQELAGVLRLLAAWAAGTGDRAEPLRHAACGTALEARWYCPTCARALADEETSELSWL